MYLASQESCNYIIIQCICTSRWILKVVKRCHNISITVYLKKITIKWMCRINFIKKFPLHSGPLCLFHYTVTVTTDLWQVSRCHHSFSTTGQQGYYSSHSFIVIQNSHQIIHTHFILLLNFQIYTTSLLHAKTTIIRPQVDFKPCDWSI